MTDTRKTLLKMMTYIQNRKTHIDIMSFTAFLNDEEIIDTIRSYAANLPHEDQMNLLAIAKG